MFAFVCVFTTAFIHNDAQWTNRTSHFSLHKCVLEALESLEYKNDCKVESALLAVCRPTDRLVCLLSTPWSIGLATQQALWYHGCPCDVTNDTFTIVFQPCRGDSSSWSFLYKLFSSALSPLDVVQCSTYIIQFF